MNVSSSKTENVEAELRNSTPSIQITARNFEEAESFIPTTLDQ